MGLSPYNSMGNSPLMYADPHGDLGFLAIVAIGAATGVFSNGLSNSNNGQGFFQGVGKAALWGGISAAASFGIGSAFGATGSFAKELGRAGAHAVSSGIQSEIQGGSFGQGALSGGLSSGIGSGIDALGGNAAAQIAGGGLGGGIGSAVSGGNFFQGFGQGVAVGAFNHALHAGLSKCCGGGQEKALQEALRERTSNIEANLTTDDIVSILEIGGYAFDLLNGGPTGEGLAMSLLLRGGGKRILVKGTDDIVDLAKFSKGKYKHWELTKDFSAGKPTSHGGSFYKLRNTHTGARYTLDKTGKVLRK